MQFLTKVPGTSGAGWVSTMNHVTGEYWCSASIEGYIDVNDADMAIVGFSAFAATPVNIDQFYKLRLLSTKRFGP